MVKKWFFASLLVVLILDIATKALVNLYRPALAVLPFFSLSYVENLGAGFGIFQGQKLFLIIVSVVALAVIAVYSPKISGKGTQSALGMMAGGILGNLVDRILKGYVVDFLDFFVGSYHWPAFNIADSALCIGAVLLVVLSTHEKAGK
jgi:signal peptidase II